ncbi:endonuclease [Deinococcus fonticola]|uniref:endonuclease n=1 Tax=Deinococcus fonticola TaxID=2528713 RepID=UPI001074AE63|nr:endonuclease [Deinococcus fonticola]
MDVPSDVLADTQARFVRRNPEREDHLQRLNVGGPLAAESPERVEARLTRVGVPMPDARAIVEGHRPLQDVTARLPEETRLTVERVLGANDLVNVAYLDLARAASRAVGRIVLRDNRGRVMGFGTGWLCSPHAILTNHHVLEAAATAKNSVIEFDYELKADGTLRERITLPLDPDALFLTSEKLDYSLVAVKGETSAFGWLPLFGSADKNVLGEALSIVQHPSGEPKQVALRENRLVDRLPDFLHYETDTAPGSSGSPVFNDAWEVVALHHSGVPRTDGQGRPLKRDGTPVGPGDPDTAIDWLANEGVRISRLLEDLRGRADAQGQPLVAEVLAANRPPLVGAPERAAPEAVNLLDLGTVRVGADGQATFPVTVRFKVGDSAATPAPPASTKPYLDPQDAARAQAYYAGVSLGTPQDNFQALSRLLTDTHTTTPRYDPAAELYPEIDVWPDGKIRSIYSAREHSPQEFIAADRAVQERRERLARLENLNVEALEEALPYNCEHVVPQSWFGKREPMRGDLHHLFSCEATCNSFRGNTPYFDFPDDNANPPSEVVRGEVVRGDCGQREPGEFEPHWGKGAVARATLYFLLRYPGVVRQYGPAQLQTLLAWHAAEAPGDWEKHRNALIGARQGNRNPLIDHPEWAEQVDFARGLGT